MRGPKGRGENYCRSSQEEGAEMMKIKVTLRTSDRGEKRGAGREPRLRNRMRGGKASRES